MESLFCKILIGSALFLFIPKQGWSQPKNTSDTTNVKDGFLHVGDRMPDEIYTTSYGKQQKIKISDFKGKLVILDLWAVWCSSCIEHMPDVEELQNIFKDQIKVLMVTKSLTNQVHKLALRSENVRNNHLPFINGEQKLAKMFNYTYVPTHIWIDKDGIIKYITSGENFTKENITNFLADKPLGFKEKPTIKIGASDKPLLVQMYPYFGDDFYIYSYLAPRDDSKYTMGGFSSSGLELTGNHKSEAGNAYTFKDLYKIAFGFSVLNNPLSDSRILIDVKDPNDYSNISKQYVYEIIVNKKIAENRVRKYIQNQLDLFFNVSSTRQKQIVPCLVIKKLHNGIVKYSTKTDTNHFEITKRTVLKVTLQWGKFIKYIDNMYVYPPYQVFDETGIDARKLIDLEMSLDFNELDKVRKSLAPFGLTINKEMRELDCIVIKSDKG
ncbi:TlpA family protein disulfide reductase [Mucilaginibacter sp.]|jgi:thiol-disulfide isomerase/thioredoxin|uniref:TlpA family protein disulfide reductase n=1 Tax=Mucilaginibacter sp. TaxID=1882438 RepID=UPI003568D665